MILTSSHQPMDDRNHKKKKAPKLTTQFLRRIWTGRQKKHREGTTFTAREKQRQALCTRATHNLCVRNHTALDFIELVAACWPVCLLALWGLMHIWMTDSTDSRKISKGIYISPETYIQDITVTWACVYVFCSCMCLCKYLWIHVWSTYICVS